MISRPAGILALLIAAVSIFEIGEWKAESPILVKVGTTDFSSDIGLFIASKRGYFSDEGLSVELVHFDSGAKMIAPLGSGDLDVGAGAISAGLFNAVNRGLKIKVVADKGTNTAEYSYKALMVRTDLVDAGKFKALADLRGKKVAIIAKGAADESVINQALLKAGLADTDIERVYLPFSQHLNAFLNKAIDAAISSEPSISIMTKQRAAVRFSGIGREDKHGAAAAPEDAAGHGSDERLFERILAA